MLHAGLDLTRKRLDVCPVSGEGEHLDQLAVAPDVDSLRRLAGRIEEVHRQPVCAVLESMTGARWSTTPSSRRDSRSRSRTPRR
jgi:hypothetical protein